MSRSAAMRRLAKRIDWLRVRRIAAVALMSAGVVILLDVGMTLAWKEPVSSLYVALGQADADGDVERLEESFPSAEGATQAELRRRAHRLANRFEGELKQGDGIGRIRIEAMGLSTSIIEGIGLNELKHGPGRYSSAALPGQGETLAIAGHRTIFGAPFRAIDELEDGDEVVLEMPYATFRYEVDRTRIVEPDQLEVVRPVGRERLVLTACHPLHSAARRYVVFAELAEVGPRSEG
jgi:sortase A